MEKRIYDKKTGIHYELQGDYYLPCLELPEQPNEIQKEIDTYTVFYYFGLGNIILYRSKDVESAKTIFSEGMSIAEQQFIDKPSEWNQFALSVCNGRMGKIMVESLKIEEAERFYYRFLELSTDLYNRTRLIEVLRNVAIGYERIGWIQQSKKDYENALKQYNKCLIESKKIYDKTKTIEALRGVAITYERLGRVAEIQGDYFRSVEYFMHNYTLSNEIYNQMGALNSKRGLANSCHCLGDAFVGQKKYGDALKWFRKDKQISLEIYTVTEMIDDIRDFAICLDRLAFSYDKLGKTDEAEKLFKDSVDLYFELAQRVKTTKLKNECIIEHIRIAEFYLIHRQNEKAAKAIQVAQSIVNHTEIDDEILEYFLNIQASIGYDLFDDYGSLRNQRNTR